MKKSFSDRLTPKQVQLVLKELGFTWDDRDVSKTGWVEFDDQTLFDGYNFSINIQHGGFADFDVYGHVNHSGDIVDLIAYMKYRLEDSYSISMESKLDAIDQIRSILDFKKGIRAPELGKYYYFTNEFLKENSFTRIPNDILCSNLSMSDKLVWIAIYRRCSPEDIYSFSSIRRIADDLCISESTVQSSLIRLEKLGLLVQKSRGFNKPKAKFPLVAITDVINETIKNVI